MTLRKINLKCYNEETREFYLYHFCYIPEHLFLNFVDVCCSPDKPFIKWLRRWIFKDFEMKIRTKQELDMAKDTIRNKAREKYPDLFNNTVTDRQGWTRVWLTDKIEKELKRCESKL